MKFVRKNKVIAFFALCLVLAVCVSRRSHARDVIFAPIDRPVMVIDRPQDAPPECPNDSDCDGLLDNAEDVNGNGTVDEGETDPENSDTDYDGILDNEEAGLGTNPAQCDTDGDGLSDGVEEGRIQPEDRNGCHGLQAAGTNYRRPHVMDPLNPDSDGDGVCDGSALENTTGCLGGEDANANGWVDPDEGDPSIVDSDSDGLADGVEARGDFDGDGVPDFDAGLIRAGQNCSPPENIADVDCDGIPNVRDGDSDNDGCIDSLEGGWLDANGNGIPDVFDNQAKACPEEAVSGGGGGGGGGARPSEPPEGDGNAGQIPQPIYAADGDKYSSCALMNKDGSQDISLCCFLFFTLAPIIIYALRRKTQSGMAS